MDKIEKLQQYAYGSDMGRNFGLLITSEENRRYLTGFPSSDGVLAVTKFDALFLTDSRYIEEARNVIKGIRVEEQKDTWKQLKEFFHDRNGANCIVPEYEKITVAQMERMKKSVPDMHLVGPECDRLDRAIEALRMVKAAEEVENIVRAQRIAEDALRHILGFIEPGKTEKEIALELDFYMLSHGADALSFETIAVSGPNGSKPHGVPGGRRVQRGDFITLDFGAVVGGLHSDMTRTVALGAVSEKQKLVYETVREAKNAVEAMMKPGVSCFDADKTARDLIAARGFDEYFRHGTGHGVGYEIHEMPFVSPKSKSVLAAGNVVTDEPGIYLPGEFGVRIEDMVLITEDGNRVLTEVTDEMIAV